ncbi:MAG: aminotransferase class I/II-fold pyridoxal phosphate-dependent enzyme [Methylococcaceae bacterium]|nr:aminotransferase class I/II-fold pyridoxal phosphate-dependent enzyme [Methylococcaceae bacterium]MDP3932185.1 aminotransferase class I/II-fold pyridoxal phosphate-dependent enzyme [Methylococcaceae bacterium]
MHGGNIYQFAAQLGCLPEQVLDFSANINPEQAADLSCLQQVPLTPYAEPHYQLLKQAFKKRYPLPAAADIEPFNGASAAIFALLRYLAPQDLVLYAPLYGEYRHIAEQLNCKLHTINRLVNINADIPPNSTVIFVNPSTPDGQLYDLQTLLPAWQAANCTIIIDESFLDFCDAESVTQLIGHIDKLYVIKSLSKFYGCAGIRIGFVVAAAQAIADLQRGEPAWKCSSLDMAYMQQALANTDFIDRTRRQTDYLRNLLYQTLQASDLFEHIYPGQANFLLARLAQGMDGYQLQHHLATDRILIRVCENFDGLDKFHVRFAVKDEPSIKQLALSLKTLSHQLVGATPPSRLKAQIAT